MICKLHLNLNHKLKKGGQKAKLKISLLVPQVPRQHIGTMTHLPRDRVNSKSVNIHKALTTISGT